jgi:tRNA (pseudouridine54-N1)-methyltransferase
MRRFLLLSHRVPPTGNFTLNDLAGGGGRMDEIARAVSTAFTLSNDLRRDTEVTVLFGAEPPPVARKIEMVGARLRYLNPDERSTAALLKNALVRSVNFPREFESSPGLRVVAADPEAELRTFLAGPGAVWMTESGTPLGEGLRSGGDRRFVISDPYDPTDAERRLLEGSGVPRLSVGPRSLRTSQVVDLVHHALDLEEASAGGGASVPAASPAGTNPG